MSEDQFTKLFKYMQKGFSETNNRVDNLESKMDKRFDEVLTIIDGYAA